MAKKIDEKLFANLPIEIIKPVVEVLYEPYKRGCRNKKSSKFPGVKEMAINFGVNESTIQKILSGKDGRKSVRLATADAITTRSSYDLDTLYDEAEKWAKKNPEKNWPENYINPKKGAV